MKNILLVSVFITNRSLSSAGDIGHSRTGSSLERLEIFLTSLRSWSKLGLTHPYFFIELDDDFAEFQGIVATEIENNFIEPTIKWKRLLYFDDWLKVSTILKKQNADLITLMANDDHAYVHADSQPFLNFSKEVLELSERNEGRVLGDLTQLPGPIRILSLYSTFNPNKGDTRRSFKVTTMHGSCLVTPSLFSEWWSSDFTEGKRIPRPDNPFGPSVKFSPTNVLIPPVEILRHMDGIGEGSRITRKYNVLRPSIRIQKSDEVSNRNASWELVETPWEYGLWPRSPFSHNKKGGPDLYRMFPVSNSPIERLQVDLSRLIVAFQKVYSPNLSREFIEKRDSSVPYVVMLNSAILLDSATFFNFLVWLLFDFPNQMAIKISIAIFGKHSRVINFLQKIRNRIFQYFGVRILQYPTFFRRNTKAKLRIE
jgi:hypothetical protein